jgi:hypothetical protein
MLYQSGMGSHEFIATKRDTDIQTKPQHYKNFHLVPEYDTSPSELATSNPGASQPVHIMIYHAPRKKLQFGTSLGYTFLSSALPKGTTEFART